MWLLEQPQFCSGYTRMQIINLFCKSESQTLQTKLHGHLKRKLIQYSHHLVLNLSFMACVSVNGKYVESWTKYLSLFCWDSLHFSVIACYLLLVMYMKR